MPVLVFQFLVSPDHTVYQYITWKSWKQVVQIILTWVKLDHLTRALTRTGKHVSYLTSGIPDWKLDGLNGQNSLVNRNNFQSLSTPKAAQFMIQKTDRFCFDHFNRSFLFFGPNDLSDLVFTSLTIKVQHLRPPKYWFRTFHFRGPFTSSLFHSQFWFVWTMYFDSHE